MEYTRNKDLTSTTSLADRRIGVPNNARNIPIVPFTNTTLSRYRVSVVTNGVDSSTFTTHREETADLRLVTKPPSGANSRLVH